MIPTKMGANASLLALFQPLLFRVLVIKELALSPTCGRRHTGVAKDVEERCQLGTKRNGAANLLFFRNRGVSMPCYLLRKIFRTDSIV
jgi:hypothetical protein